MKKHFMKITSALLSLILMVSFPAGAYANTRATATALELGKAYSFRFTNYDDDDYDSSHWYSFTPSSTGYYQIKMDFNNKETSDIKKSWINFYDENIQNQDSFYYNSKQKACIGYLKLKANYKYLFEAICSQENQDTNFKISSHTHKLKTDIEKADSFNDGYVDEYCTICDYNKTTKIPKLVITVNKSKYVYDGKVKKPTVTIKDRKGKVFKNGVDYEIANYPASAKDVDEYSIDIFIKNKNYNSSESCTFKIVPKGTSIKKITAKKKAFTVKWKKQNKQTTGYKIQYSTDKKFKKGIKTVTVKGPNKTNATVKKLKGNKKYYVRICTYKGKITSSWSKVKTVKTKK